MSRSRGWGERLVRGIGAFVVADLITGLAAFSMITLSGLWVFAFDWIRLSGEYAPLGIHLGAAWQLDLAWVGELVCLPMIGATAYLAYEAFRLPRAIWNPPPQRSPGSLSFLRALGTAHPELRRHR